VDKELAEFIGLYVGDGSIDVRPEKSTYEFKIVGNPKDEIPYYSFVSSLTSTIAGRKIKPKILDCGRSVGIRFCSKNLFEELKRISLSSTPQTLKRKIPIKILKRRGLYVAFLRGLFDTDDCFTVKKKHKIKPYYPVIGISQKNASLIRQVAELLTKLKIQASVRLNWAYRDKRTGRMYRKSWIYIYGNINVAKWFGIIGTHNPKIKDKYQTFLAK